MEPITFYCKTITPMFLSGADGQTPELRPPSIKGALRFWWRAMNGHLGLEDTKDRQDNKTVVIKAGLHSQEAAIFGGAGGDSGGQRSSFSIQVNELNRVSNTFPLVPHKGMQQSAIAPGTTFEVILRVPEKYSVQIQERNKAVEIFNQEKLIALFQLTCLLGGMGKRVRRGMGSVFVSSVHTHEEDTKNLPTSTTLSEIADLIKIVTPHYTLTNDRIVQTYSGNMQPYGWIRYIQIGKPTNDLLRKISDTTHQLHGERGYEESLGHATKGRFASPVYVSVLNGEKMAIITTLNTIPDRNKDQISLGLQEEFRNRIL